MSPPALLALRHSGPEQLSAIRLGQVATGVSPGEISTQLRLLRHVAALLPPGHLPPSEQWFLAILEAGGAHRCFLEPSGGLGFALQIVLFDAGARGLYALITLRDAAAARFNVEWCAAERLEAVVATCGALAHQANNILTCLQSPAEQLSDLQNLPDGAATASLDIVAAVERWKRLSGRLGRLGAALRPRPGQCDPAQTLAQLAQRLRSSLPGEVRLTVEAPSGQGLLLASALGLERVLEELVANAVQAVGARGHIHLKAGHHEEAASPGFGWLDLSVVDDGPGISDAALRAVGQGVAEQVGGGRSIHLGLLTARAFAQGLGGRLLATRLPIRGTHIALQIPVLKLSSYFDRHCPSANPQPSVDLLKKVQNYSKIRSR